MGALTLGMLLTAGSIFTHQFESMVVRHYGKKHRKGGIFFNAMVCLFAVVYLVITDKGGFMCPNKLWVYALTNAAVYAIGFYAGFAAFKSGSFGLTKLFTSFGILLPTFYGILFLKEPASIYTYIALALITFSLFLMNYQKNEDANQERITLKWILFVLLTILSNAAISILGKIQTAAFGDAYTNEFLIVTYLGATVFLLIFSLSLERHSLKEIAKPAFFCGMGAGLFNAISNLLTLFAYNYLPISFISPFKSGIGIVLGFALARFLYKERFSALQYIGVGIGIIAVVLMSLKF